GGGALDGTYTFQPAATTTLAVACRNLGGWVHPHHVELSELVFAPDGTLDDPLALDDVRLAVTALVGRGPAPADDAPREVALTAQVRRCRAARTPRGSTAATRPPGTRRRSGTTSAPRRSSSGSAAAAPRCTRRRPACWPSCRRWRTGAARPCTCSAPAVPTPS